MKTNRKSLKLTNNQVQTLWVILSEVQKTVETGEKHKGVVFANYENYLLALDSHQIDDLDEIIKQL